MKILLVTESEENRKKLRELFIENIRNIECFEAKTGMESLQMAKRYVPDFIFLDVHLIDGTGFEISSLLHDISSHTKFVFMGVNVEEAVASFRFHAFYYLLQPFEQEDLQFLLHTIEQEKEKNEKSRLRKLPIEMHDGISYIFPKDIVYVSKNKENKTVSIYTTNNQYISTYTLQELEGKLAVYDFLRVHKSYLINVTYVQDLKPYCNGTYNLYLTKYDDQPIPVSRNYVKRLRNKIEL
ncbi:LytR/AlgR family response regulator transcription factor [Bacillus manliponensis]|uniref:LytR/AlgR family response regulator transcription factor n=1 Tax=Bacillus manliponensis TaxID=574376 RepID=UPI003513B999